MGVALKERRAVVPGVYSQSPTSFFCHSVQLSSPGNPAKALLSQEEISNRSNGAKKVVPLSVQIESYAPRVGGLENRPADVERRTRMPKEVKNQTSLYSKYTM